MDAAAPGLKREAPEPWVDVDGVPVPATKIRRLDAAAPPVEFGVGAPLVGPGLGPGAGAGVLPPPHHAFGVGEVRASGGVAAPAMDATPLLLKRKGAEAPQPWLDFDGVAAPATKIRRLDAEVPPVEPAVGVPPQPFVAGEVPMSGDVAPLAAAVGVAAPAVNEERAIVVYQPAEAARSLLQGPLRPGASLRVSPDWIHGVKSMMLQEASNRRALFEELVARDENLNLAMVPWAPAQVHALAASSSAAAAAEMMDADQDGDGASMEVERDVEGQPTPAAGGALQGEAFHHHQQQWPTQLQLPTASYHPSPITWSR